MCPYKQTCMHGYVHTYTCANIYAKPHAKKDKSVNKGSHNLRLIISQFFFTLTFIYYCVMNMGVLILCMAVHQADGMPAEARTDYQIL